MCANGCTPAELSDASIMSPPTAELLLVSLHCVSPGGC
jgi:hypothetical protein